MNPNKILSFSLAATTLLHNLRPTAQGSLAPTVNKLFQSLNAETRKNPLALEESKKPFISYADISEVLESFTDGTLAYLGYPTTKKTETKTSPLDQGNENSMNPIGFSVAAVMLAGGAALYFGKSSKKDTVDAQDPIPVPVSIKLSDPDFETKLRSATPDQLGDLILDLNNLLTQYRDAINSKKGLLKTGKVKSEQRILQRRLEQQAGLITTDTTGNREKMLHHMELISKMIGNELVRRFDEKLTAQTTGGNDKGIIGDSERRQALGVLNSQWQSYEYLVAELKHPGFHIDSKKRQEVTPATLSLVETKKESVLRKNRVKRNIRSISGNLNSKVAYQKLRQASISNFLNQISPDWNDGNTGYRINRENHRLSSSGSGVFSSETSSRSSDKLPPQLSTDVINDKLKPYGLEKYNNGGGPGLCLVYSVIMGATGMSAREAKPLVTKIQNELKLGDSARSNSNWFTSDNDFFIETVLPHIENMLGHKINLVTLSDMTDEPGFLISARSSNIFNPNTDLLVLIHQNRSHYEAIWQKNNSS